MRRTGIAALSVATMALLACGGSTSTEMGHGPGGGSSSGRGSSDPDSGVVGTGAATDAGFAVGSYGMCMLTDEPNTLGGSFGGASVSSENGSLVVRFGDGSAPGSLTFSQTSPTSASRSPSKQKWVGPWTWCGGGVSARGGIADPVPGVGTLDVESGMATYNASTLFVTIAGTVEPVDGGGCSSGPLSAALTCAKD
jgi:hypothetical protein